MHIYSLLTIATLASVCCADVWTTSPTADTRWAKGAKTEITWKVKGPSTRTYEHADIYLVGGDYRAYRRLVRLGKDIPLSSKRLVVESVPEAADCADTCAIEFFVARGADYYSHNFTIAPAAELQPNPKAPAGVSTPLKDANGNGGNEGKGPTPQSQHANAQGAGLAVTTNAASVQLAVGAATTVLAAAGFVLSML